MWKYELIGSKARKGLCKGETTFAKIVKLAVIMHFVRFL